MPHSVYWASRGWTSLLGWESDRESRKETVKAFGFLEGIKATLGFPVMPQRFMNTFPQ
jgi:hypothetical protein